MGTLNRIALLGRLGHDPEVRTSSNGKTYVRMSIATDRRHRSPEGVVRKETQWHSVFVWGKNADLCVRYCKRGHAIYVEGHLSSFTAVVDGQKRYSTSIMVDQVQLIAATPTEARDESELNDVEDSEHHLDELEQLEENEALLFEGDNAPKRKERARPYQLN